MSSSPVACGATMVTLRASPEIWAEVSASYREQLESGSNCDVVLFGSGEEGVVLGGVECHSMVICSAVPFLYDLLLNGLSGEDQRCRRTVLLPDVSRAELANFVETVYANLARKDFVLPISSDLADVFGFTAGGGAGGERSSHHDAVHGGCTLVFPHGNDDEDDAGSGRNRAPPPSGLPGIADGTKATSGEGCFPPGSGTDHPEDHSAGQRPVRREDPWRGDHPVSKMVPSLGSFLQVIDGKLVLTSETIRKQLGSIIAVKRAHPSSCRPSVDPGRGRTRAKKSLRRSEDLRPAVLPDPPDIFQDEPPSPFQPGLHSANQAADMTFLAMAAMFGHQQGSFWATSQAYYTTSKIVDDRQHKCQFSSGNESRVFRMKLPDKRFVALVALGVVDGKNVASTLAIKSSKSWSHEKTMYGIVDMIKNICGTNFSTILRHPRCWRGQSEISRQNIDRYKQAFSPLSKVEKINVAKDCQSYLDEFERPGERPELQHLPQTPMRMSFELTPDRLTPSKIKDYAILYGKTGRDLIIRSFFNLRYQKISDVRKTTILLDTLACFLDFNNTRPITDFKPLQDLSDSFSLKTSQILALKEKGINGQDRDSRGRLVIESEGGRKLADHNAAPVEENLRTTGKDSSLITASGIKKSDLVPTGREMRTCVPCGKVLTSKKQFDAHMIMHHKPTKCFQCAAEFPGFQARQTHYLRVHQKKETCQVCGAVVRGRKELRLHMIGKHMEDHLKPFICSLCGKGFAEKTKLKSHEMNIHIRSRPYKCRVDGCLADFNHYSNRNSHERKVHKYDFMVNMSKIRETVSKMDVEDLNALKSVKQELA